MSAELALMNQILQKSLKNDVPVSQTDLSFKVTINTGDEPIPEGSEIQIGQDGKAYPLGFNEAAGATGVVSTSPVLTSPIMVYRSDYSYRGKSTLHLGDNYYMGIYQDDIYLYKYDETSGRIAYVKYFANVLIDRTMTASHTNFITKLDDSHFILRYAGTTALDNIALFTFDKTSETIVVKSETAIACSNPNSYGTDLVVLDEFRFLWVGEYNNNAYYQCFELAQNKNSFTFGSRTLIPGGTGNYYFQVIDHTMGVPNGAYILNINLVMRCEPKFPTGKEVNFYDVTGTPGFEDMTLITSGNNFNTSLKDLSSRESGESGELLKFNNLSTDPDYGKFMLFSFNQTTGEPIVKKYTSLDTIFHYNSSDVYIKSDESTWFCYKVSLDSYSANTGKNHMIFKITLDDVQSTYKVDVLVNMPTSTLNTTDSSRGGGNRILDFALDGSLFANIFLFNTQQSESVKVSGTILNYTKTRLRAATSIAANTEGIAIVEGQAFQEIGRPAGSFFLNKFIITDTNYAVEVIQ